MEDTINILEAEISYFYNEIFDNNTDNAKYKWEIDELYRKINSAKKELTDLYKLNELRLRNQSLTFAVSAEMTGCKSGD